MRMGKSKQEGVRMARLSQISPHPCTHYIYNVFHYIYILYIIYIYILYMYILYIYSIYIYTNIII